MPLFNLFAISINRLWDLVPGIVVLFTLISRPIVSKFWSSITQGTCNEINVPRVPLQDCIKTAFLTTSGRLGVRLCFDSDKEEVLFSADNIAIEGSVDSYMSERIPMDKKDFSEDVNASITFRAEHLKEITNKYKGDKVRFKIQGSDQSVIILDEKEDFVYLSSVIRQI